MPVSPQPLVSLLSISKDTSAWRKEGWSISTLLLSAVLLLMAAPAAGQVPDAEAPDRGRVPDRHALKQTPATRSPIRKHRANSTAQLKIDTTPANLLTRAGTDLTGVAVGSSSIADVDGDGNRDLLITGDTNGAFTSGGESAKLYLEDGNGGFIEANVNPIGVQFSSSTIADVDGDGNLDLLITGYDGSTQTATLYLGDGSGGFSEANAGLTGVAFGSTSIADANGNGNRDLLITGDDTSGSPSATLYLGDGSGDFSEANANLTGVKRSSSTIADVDGDGNRDLLITGDENGCCDNGGRTATLYLGDGNGGFTEANAGLTGVKNGSSSIADVDGDGNQDLLITGQDENFNPTATLYLGNGSGGFSEAGAGLTGVFESSSSIADANGDGNPDLLITGDTNGVYSSGGQSATLYLGDGSGGFSKANPGLTGVEFSSSSIADVDGDGDADIVVTGFGGLFDAPSARVYVNRTVQQSPNQSPRITHVPDLPLVAPGRTVTGLIEAGDPDGDKLSLSRGSAVDSLTVTDAGNGTAEIAFTPSRSLAGQSVTLTVEASDGNGKTDTDSVTVDVADDVGVFDAGLTGVDFGSSSSIADVNGDGNQDLLITGYDSNRDTRTATLYLGDGNGGFTEANAGLTGVKNGSSSIADVDGDGNQDLLITGSGTATLYLGDGSEDFTEANAGLTGVNFSSSSIADVDGDGNQDLLITGEEGSTPTATLYLGDGTGGFAEANAGLTGVASSSSSIADVNGDGNQDLLITGNATLYLGDGSGSFSEANAGLNGVDFGSSSIADVDGDGNQDLLITGDTNGFDSGGLSATLYLGDGTGGFSEANADLTGVFRSSSSVADADGDGNPDLLITGLDANSNSTATLYLGDGSGGFTEANADLIGVQRSSSSFGDVDNDGNADLLITGRDANGNPTSTLYENLASGKFLAASSAKTVSSNGSVAFGNTGASITFSGTGGSGDVTVQRFSNPPTNPLGIQKTNVSNYRFVISAAGDLTFADSTELRLDVSTLDGVSDASNVTVYRRSVRGNGVFDSLSTTYDSGSNELVAQTGAFSEFVLASDTEPLPVELAKFDAQTGDGQVRLSWTTASETNNAGFRIQRRVASAPGVRRAGDAETEGRGEWTTVGKVSGAGTTTEAQDYHFTDANLPYEADALTYRLKQVDTDGTAHYSKTVTVKRGVTKVQLLGTYPNPAVQQTTVRYALPEKREATIRLYDVLGRQVRTVVSSKRKGRHEQRLDVSGLPSGVYFLRLTAGGQTRTQKLTVVR